MKAYLVENEIEEIKGLKNQRINYSELNDLKKYLENNGKKLSLNQNENSNNVYDIVFDKHKDKILESKYYKQYREQNPAITSYHWKETIFGLYMDKIDPDGYNLYCIAQSINLNDNREMIISRLNQLGIVNFDIDSFLLNKDFDFSPYTIKQLDKKEYDSLSDASNKILDLFQDITKGLSDEDKTVYKNNFLQIIDYTVKNINKNDLKEKNNVFRNLLNYINGKRISK